jgi:hypothetical protein
MPVASRAGNSSIQMGKTPSLKHASTTCLRCSGRSITVLLIIAVSWPGLFMAGTQAVFASGWKLSLVAKENI